MNEWVTVANELPTNNGAEIEIMMEDFTPREGKVSIICDVCPFLIKEKDGCYWRHIGNPPLYWRYKNVC